MTREEAERAFERFDRKPEWAATNKGMRAAPMKMHCEKLVETYKKAAEENSLMEAEHRKMKM